MITAEARRQMEANLSAAEAKAHVQQRYDDTGKVPATRFRVEGSRVGTSKFLSKQQAVKTMTLYGGRVVEYLPDTKRPRKQKLTGAHEW